MNEIERAIRKQSKRRKIFQIICLLTYALKSGKIKIEIVGK